MSIRTYRRSLPITGIGEPTYILYEFETGDVELVIQNNTTNSSPSIASEEIFSGSTSGPVIRSNGGEFRITVGPGDVLRIATATVADLRVLVRSVTA